MPKIKNKRNKYIVIGSIATLVTLGVLLVLNQSNILRIGDAPSADPVPVFSFDQSSAPNWWSGSNYNGQAGATEEYEGNEPIDMLPVASLNVFNGKQGEHATACFVMFSYYDYKTDIAKLKAEKEAGVSKGGAKFENTGAAQSTIYTPDGIKLYTLTKYELSGPGTEESMKGMSYGWVELDDGYIQVSGVCPTAGELDDTVHISESVSLLKP